MKKVWLFDQIYEVVKTISVHAENLLYELTNNHAESFNALVAVEEGGKRINSGLRSQYNMRVNAAVIRHDTEALLSSVYMDRVGFVPHIVDTVDTARIKKKCSPKNIETDTGA